MTLDVGAARARFSALQRSLVFFDGPGGTQVPDEVIEAISRYFREYNANTSGPYETSRRTEELALRTRETAGRFLGCAADEVRVRPEHDDAELRALADDRTRFRGGRRDPRHASSTTTRTSHRGWSSPPTRG